jgi:hypothetical protein
MFANLEGLENYASRSDHKKQYTANATTWDKFAKSKDSLEQIKKLFEETKASLSTLSLDQALSMYETLLKKYNPINKSYTFYLRTLLEARKAEPSKPGYVEKKAIVVALQCPKGESVGFGCLEPCNKTATGDYFETVMYPFLKGMSL